MPYYRTDSGKYLIRKFEVSINEHFKMLENKYYDNSYILKSFIFRMECNDKHHQYKCDACGKSYLGGIMFKLQGIYQQKLGQYFHEKCFNKYWMPSQTNKEPKEIEVETSPSISARSIFTTGSIIHDENGYLQQMLRRFALSL